MPHTYAGRNKQTNRTAEEVERVSASHFDRLVYLCFYAIETVFQLYHNHGGDMMYEMRRRTPESTLVLTQRIFNLPLHIDMI